MQSPREMSAVLTSRDHALRLALWLVVATEALLFALGVVLGGASAPSVSLSALVATLALVGATASPRHRLVFGSIAFATELIGLPTHDGKATMFVAGLHAAHVLAGLVLAGWTLALPRWRRARMEMITSRYWTFVAIAWLAVLFSAHRP